LTPNRDIYPNLKLRIYSVGMRQNRLAKMLGIDEAYLSRIINGYREPNGNIRESLAQILHSDPEWLFHKVQINDELSFADRPGRADGSPNTASASLLS
jgi:transcriptional regulator with XRE-family HTH domain